jgi:hypothetical protein
VYIKTTPYAAVINYPVKGVLSAAVGMTTGRLFQSGVKQCHFRSVNSLLSEF